MTEVAERDGLLGCDCGKYVAPARLSLRQQLAALSAHQRSDRCSQSRDMRLASMGASLDAIEDVLREALTHVSALRAQIAAVDALCGRDYEHEHPPVEGYPECPACWIDDIRQALGLEP